MQHIVDTQDQFFYAGNKITKKSETYAATATPIHMFTNDYLSFYIIRVGANELIIYILVLMS